MMRPKTTNSSSRVSNNVLNTDDLSTESNQSLSDQKLAKRVKLTTNKPRISNVGSKTRRRRGAGSVAEASAEPGKS